MNLKTRASTLFIVSLLVLSTALGCTTIRKDLFGKKQLVTFNSEPDGATVTVNGIVLGTTPLTTEVEARKEAVLHITLDGYKHHQARMFTRLDSWFWGNIITGGFYGSTTDYVTENMWKYRPNTYYVQLEQIAASNESAAEWNNRNRLLGFLFANKRRLNMEFATGIVGEATKSLSQLTGLDDSQVASLGMEYLASSDLIKFANACESLAMSVE